MRETLQDIYLLANKEEAKIALKKLIRWMKLSRIKPMITAGNTLEENLDNILNYFDDRYTNATLEGMNNIIQNIKGSARGFRNIEYWKAIIYLYCGDFKVEVFDKNKDN